MQVRFRLPFTILMLGLLATPALADKYSDALHTFRNAGQSAHFFGASVIRVGDFIGCD